MIKEKDFIEVEYTGNIVDTNEIFDTTDEKIAKSSKIFNPNVTYGPIVICIGEGHIINGLDEELKGKELGKYTITLSPEKAFGKKNPKLLQLISQSSFKKQNISPYPGLQINLDGIMGIIRTVTPGRVIVDFNHPLAGKTLKYEIKINKKIEDEKTKLDSLLMFYTKKPKTEIKAEEAVITSSIPKQLEANLNKKITTLIPSIKKISFKKE